MTKYVPQYRYDVFLSYAHVDDALAGGEPPGWVTSFKKHIEIRLAQILGRSDAFEIFMDHDLKHTEGITPQLLDVLDETAVLLVILSPGYAASEWCQRERNKFLETAASRTGTRIIVVEREPYEDENNPGMELIPDRKRFQFWGMDDTNTARILGPPVRVEQPWYDRIDDVSRELARALRELRAEEGPTKQETRVIAGEEAEGTDLEPRTVFLAHVTDDLDSLRDAMTRRLEEHGISVLPHGYYSLNPEAFRASAKRDMAKSQLFVQLLSGTAGKKPPDVPSGYLQLQFDLAKAADIEILQWRRPELELDTIADTDHRNLLDSPTVRAQALESFTKEIIGCALTPKTTEQPRPGTTQIFVCADPSDRSLAEKLASELGVMGVECSLPSTSEDPGEYRKDLNKKLIDCDGLIVAFENAPMSWVQGRLDLRARALALRSQLPTAVYAARGYRDDELAPSGNGVALVDGSLGYDGKSLSEFVAGLQQ